MSLDESKIAAKVNYENLTGGTVLYPHIYGVLNCDAIIAVYYFNAVEDGTFTWPDSTEILQLDFSENHFLNLAKKIFLEHKSQAERAMIQLVDSELFSQDNKESNSIAILVQHLSGNMISRWTNFLTSDGEKESRERDAEFTPKPMSRDELMVEWEQGWSVLFNTLEALTSKDVLKTVYIRGEALSVMKAITRQISHYAFHTGQIVYIAKQFKAEKWQTLSIAPGQSKQFRPSL